MPEMTQLVIVLIFMIVFIPPFLLLRPLVAALANRIAGKRNDAGDVKELKNRVALLEKDLSSLQQRFLHIEERSDFEHKLGTQAASQKQIEGPDDQ